MGICRFSLATSRQNAASRCLIQIIGSHSGEEIEFPVDLFPIKDCRQPMNKLLSAHPTKSMDISLESLLVTVYPVMMRRWTLKELITNGRPAASSNSFDMRSK